MKIEELSHETLAETIALVNQVFAYEASTTQLPERALRASLDLKENQAFMQEQGIKALVYIVARDDATNQVLGVVGQYVKETDPPGVMWVGWFCVDPAFRRHHVGQTLLAYNMDKARENGYTTMKLYTSDHLREQAAQGLYDRLGFAVTRKQPIARLGITLLYRERQL